MKNHFNISSGFVWLPLLLIVLGVLAVSGGAYYVMHQTPSQIVSENNLNTLPTTQRPQTQGQTTNTPAVQSKTNNSTETKFTATPNSGTAPLTVNFSGTFDTKVTGDARGNYIDFGDAGPNCNSSGDPCFSSVADTNPSCATNSTVCTIKAISHTYLTPGTYIAKLMNNNREKVENGTIQGKIVGSILTITETKVIVSSNANAQAVSVNGMSKYTDTDFGFSFWYPSGWFVTSIPVSDADQALFQGGTVVRELDVHDYRLVADSTRNVTIREFTSLDKSITFPALSAKGYGPKKYYFDPSAHQWMEAWWDDSHASAAGTTTADVSSNSMGGLHLFAGQWPYGVTAVPLSASNFVLVESVLDQTYLAKTITATDPSVATPVSAAQQTATIQAEQSAYAGQ